MDLVQLIISLVSGAVGGNLGGAAIGDKNLGGVANTILGLLGGGVGDFILKALGVIATGAATHAATGAPAAQGSELDLGTLLASIVTSGASGGVLAALAGVIKDAVNKK